MDVIKINAEFQTHTFEPVFDKNSQILVLGTFPSVKSRENEFYYGHPQNRFWRVLSAVFNDELPTTNSEKKEFLLRNHVAVWDVIKSCKIAASADSTIKSVEPNDLSVILDYCNIKKIYANGKTAEKLYNQFIKKQTKINIIPLPSTSPANAQWNLQRLVDEWNQIKL